MAGNTPLRDQVQTTLGDSYTLERELSGGGMSHVFVAEEKALGRKIVVKVLPMDATAAVSVERFKREIQVAARLQHPHIVPLLSAGEINGLPFYTMPFVKGESLRTRVSRGGELSINESVHYLRDVAAALAYAHGEGVVHRDIKPDNVIVSGGVAVVTDFGVSKAIDVAANAGDKGSGITSIGVALGTPAYMSPEQASADPQVDHRADIYSFGCLAYELLAGSSPFAGRPPQQMLAAHVSESPESISKRRPTVPPGLAALVMKCLEKRAGDRPQSAEELLSSLDAVGTPSGGMVPTAEKPGSVRRGSRIYVLAGIGIALAAAVAFAWSRMNRVQPYGIGATTPLAVSPDIETSPAISPDGKIIAYVITTEKGDRIFLRQIDGGRATMIDAEMDGNHGCPQWSPDGSRVSFCAEGGIYTVAALTGGTPKRVVPGGTWHAWSRDGSQIAFTEDRKLWIAPAQGGERKKLAEEPFIHSPSISPNSRFVAYSVGRPPTLTNLSANSIWIAPVNGGAPRRISDSTHINLSPVWTPDGKSVLYISDRGGVRDVYEQRVSSSGEASGAPVRVSTALGSYWISLSADGTRLAYDVVRNYSNIYEIPLDGKPRTVTAGRQVTRENQHIETLGVSPDGKWIAYDSDRSGNFDIYKMRLDGGEPVQMTTDPAPDFGPSWSPSGDEVAFHSMRSGNRDILIASAEGGGEKQVTGSDHQDFFPQWSPDGRQLGFSRESGGKFSYMAVSRKPDGSWSEPTVLGSSGLLTTSEVQWSPNGEQIAFLHRDGVVIRPTADTTSRILVSVKDLGAQALGFDWSADGTRIYVYAGGRGTRGSIYEVPVAGGQPKLVLSDELNARFGRWLFTVNRGRLFYTRANWEGDVWVMELKR